MTEQINPDAYQGLNETEKNTVITRAIIRLRNRIHTLLFASELETEKRDRLIPDNKMAGNEVSDEAPLAFGEMISSTPAEGSAWPAPRPS